MMDEVPPEMTEAEQLQWYKDHYVILRDQVYAVYEALGLNQDFSG
jgi:hypothetical protein